MPLTELLLPEFDAEMKKTRKTLERLSDDKDEYRPHEKSMPLGKLANHIMGMPGFLTLILNAEEFDVAKPGARPAAPASAVERLESYDAAVASSRAVLAETSDEAMHGSWKLIAGERAIFSGTRYEAVRSFFFNHMIHHRAQLGVYLRMTGCPVPSIYGPSADESV